MFRFGEYEANRLLLWLRSKMKAIEDLISWKRSEEQEESVESISIIEIDELTNY